MPCACTFAEGCMMLVVLIGWLDISKRSDWVGYTFLLYCQSESLNPEWIYYQNLRRIWKFVGIWGVDSQCILHKMCYKNVECFTEDAMLEDFLKPNRSPIIIWPRINPTQSCPKLWVLDFSRCQRHFTTWLSVNTCTVLNITEWLQSRLTDFFLTSNTV